MYLGVEIGGTKLQLGLGPGDGKLLRCWRGPVEVAAGGEGIRRQIARVIPELLAEAGIDAPQLHGVGIGFGGPVDDATQTVVKSHQIQGWENFPLVGWLRDRFGWPAVLGNDADVAGLAEAHYGAGKGLSPIFYITIGSGIGGGLIINGDIHRGCGQGAAEIGHLRIPVQLQDGIRHVPLEEIASGWGIQQWAQHEIAKRKPNGVVLGKARRPDEPITALEVAEAARAGDDTAWYILYRAWESLAEAICHVIALVCPRRIVIGGGVSLMGEQLLFEPLRKLVAERVFKPFAGCYDIVPAELGEEVVVHGALALARRHVANFKKA
jgi:glucokinase